MYYDVRGEYDIMGEEIMGALVRAGLRAPGRPYSPRVTPSGASVRTAEPSRSRRMPLQVDSGATLIAAAAAATITVQPPSPFRAEKFVVSPLSAPNFLINSINIGRMNQLLGTGALDAALLSAENPETALQFDTAQTSVNLSVGVTNSSGGGSRFLAAFLGTLIE